MITIFLNSLTIKLEITKQINMSPIQKYLFDLRAQQAQEELETAENQAVLDSIKDALFLSWLSSPEATALTSTPNK